MTRRDPSLKAGDLFQNQFEILGLLGSGGHAFVYRAHDQIMSREVALKLIEIPAGSASDRRRRAREAIAQYQRLRLFEFATASPGAVGSAFTGASARAENQASAGPASRTRANSEQAALPGSGLHEPRAARARAPAQPRPRTSAALLPQFGPEDIR